MIIKISEHKTDQQKETCLHQLLEICNQLDIINCYENLGFARQSLFVQNNKEREALIINRRGRGIR